MLKRHKTLLFEKISEGYNPNDFEFFKISELVDKLKVKDSSLYFNFIQKEHNYEVFQYSYTNFAPKPAAVAPATTYYFSKVLEIFDSLWLKKEVSQFFDEKLADDVFESFQKKQAEFNFENINFESKIFFSSQEKQVIIDKLNYLNTYLIETFSRNEADKLRIESSIKHLAESLDKQTKFDFRGIFITTIIGIISALTIDTTRGNELWNLIVDLFKQIPLLGK